MRAPRDPILDPWSDDASFEPPHAAVGTYEGSREEGVFTSAAPLSMTLERGDRPTPPVPPPTPEQAGAFDDAEPAVEVEIEPAAPSSDPARDHAANAAEAAPEELEDLEPAPPSTPPAPVVLPLEEVDTFADLPSEVLAQLARAARVEVLEPDDELGIHGVSLVLSGDGAVCAAVADTPARIAAKFAVIPARGSLQEGVAMRLVVGPLGATVASWDQPTFEAILRDCPWALDELSALSDQLQILAGAALGPLGELDVDAREVVMARFGVRAKAPGELVFAKGQPLDLVVVGAGSLHVEGETEPLGPGDWLFTEALIRRGNAPNAVHAGPGGALLLASDRHVAQELFVSVPPLLEMLSR